MANVRESIMNPIVYLNPNTKIDILKGVPLPQNYQHVCSFSSAADTYQAFQTYIKYSMVNATPVKIPNAVRVNRGFNDLADCNYLIFSNYSEGTNLIYAFITDMLFVNYNTTEIHYRVDIWTTNYAKASFGKCYVEREHVNDDTFGKHTIPEGLETGRYINIGNDSFMYDMNNTCILYTPRASESKAGSIVNGVYSGLIVYNIYNKTDEAINSTLKLLTEDWQYPEVIQAIFHYPSFMTDDGVGNKITDVEMPLNLDGYVPKNKKCFTKEFCYVLADDLTGNTAEYAFEDSTLTSHKLQFRSCGTYISQPVINTYPLNYKGLVHCYNEGITTNNFPQCSWSSDTFSAWYAQNRSLMSAQTITGVINTVVPTALSAASMAGGGASSSEVIGQSAVNAVSGATSVLNNAINNAAKKETVARQPNQAHGQIFLDSLNIADKRTRIQFYTMSVRREVIEQIDGFFETFGYRVNTLKQPNITGRPYWNFVKCSNAVVNGDLYMETTGEMEAILNNGVTIWHSLGNIGNYSLNNH